MIHGNIELHNIAEIQDHDGVIAMQRVPEALRLKLNGGAQNQILSPAGSEIRFVAEPGTPVRVTLSSTGQCTVVPFISEFRQSGPVTVGAEPVTIEITWNNNYLRSLDHLRELPLSFDPTVVRLVMFGSPIRLHKVEGTGIRPPEADEVPALRYLAYGTSITHGFSAIAGHLTYAAQCARRLGADLLNFGVAGACHCEPEFADYLAAREDWDVASLALSVNMMGFKEEEFRQRVRYFVHTVAGSNPERPVACITIYPYFGSLMAVDEHSNPLRVETFRQILRDAVEDCPTPNAFLIEGPDLLPDFGGLTCDLIHPADDGMIQIGENLAWALTDILAPDDDSECECDCGCGCGD